MSVPQFGTEPETWLANHLDRRDPSGEVIDREMEQEREAERIAEDLLGIVHRLTEWESNDGACAMTRIRDDLKQALARVEKLRREVV